MADSVAKVNGIGGVFIYANDARSLSEWYGRHFGLEFTSLDSGKTFYLDFHYRNDKDPAKRERTVFSIMSAEKRLPAERREFMVNYRVEDLDRFLEQLKRSGIEIEKTEEYEYGRFAWIRDPEGNRIELWQPIEK